MAFITGKLAAALTSPLQMLREGPATSWGFVALRQTRPGSAGVRVRCSGCAAFRVIGCAAAARRYGSQRKPCYHAMGGVEMSFCLALMKAKELPGRRAWHCIMVRRGRRGNRSPASG